MIWFGKKKDSLAALRAKLEAAVMQVAFYRMQNAEIKVANQGLRRELKVAAAKISLLESLLDEAAGRLRDV